MSEKENGESDVREWEGLSKRDLLFNEVLETVIKYGKGMEIGLVSAVLAEVESEIQIRTGRQDFTAICNSLKRRESGKCNMHSPDPD